MPYSLVSTATIGFDLVRLPAGRAVAQVLLDALGAGPAELAHYAAAHPRHAAAPAERGALAVRSRRARELAAAGVPRLVGMAAPGPGAAPSTAAVLAAQLEVSMIGDVASLERLLRDDVLAAVPALEAPPGEQDVHGWAADVLADAAVAGYAAAQLPPDLRRALSAPYADATASAAPPAPALGPQEPAVRAVLAHVRDAGAAGRAAWRSAVDEARAGRRAWAQAMHEACWAAHVSGRTRTAAAALLLGVLAFDDAGFEAADGAAGVWNALAGVVQGLVVADVLGAEALDVLLAPWRSASGAPLLLAP